MKASCSTTSEHWLTLMTCTVCHKTPDCAPIYKCTFGHPICLACFNQLAANLTIPICNVCDSDVFTIQKVSSEFLRKLKTKPGIGRPCRYQMDSKTRKVSSETMEGQSGEDGVTVEKLFQLGPLELQQLFDDNNKDKIRHLNSLSCGQYSNSMFLKYDRREEDSPLNGGGVFGAPDCRSSSLKDSASLMSGDLQSRKPLKCPHDSCRKIIAVSSFQSHFKYEHFDLKNFNLERGKELTLDFNPGAIETNKNTCLGIIRLFETDNSMQSPSTTDHREEKMTDENGRKLIEGRFTTDQEVDTFWVMVSTSGCDDPYDQAYILFWLFTNNEEFYNCTLELSSQHEAMTMTTFCGVNGVLESQNPSEILHGLNCLYVTEGTVRSMLAYGVKMKFRIVIH